MAFTFAAFCYMLTLVLCAALIFFVIWQVSGTVHTAAVAHTETKMGTHRACKHPTQADKHIHLHTVVQH